jgi:hypothetical protein
MSTVVNLSCLLSEAGPAPAAVAARHQTRPLQHVPTAGCRCAGWGVAHTSVAVGAGLTEQENYLWSVGNDPFSPLSRTPGVSFAQIDAAKRNLVLTELNKTTSNVRAPPPPHLWVCHASCACAC